VDEARVIGLDGPASDGGPGAGARAAIRRRNGVGQTAFEIIGSVTGEIS